MEGDVVDISHLFWQFVRDVMELSYSKLSETPGFMALSTHNGFVVSFSTLGLTAPAASHCTGLTGIYQDDAKREFVFSDVTSLLSNTPKIVKEPGQKTLLKACLQKINRFVDVQELATDLEQSLELHVVD